MTKGSKKRGGRNTLFILALFLGASAALRLGDGLGKALAANGDSATVPQETGAMCSETPEALAKALKERAELLTQRERALQERKAALALADQVITERLAALEKAEAELAATLAIADGAAEDDLARLTAVYEAMKPKDAAKLFESMDPEFAAGFFGRMRPDAVGPILSGMSSEAAYTISAILAGRNALAPKE